MKLPELRPKFDFRDQRDFCLAEDIELKEQRTLISF